MTTRDDISSGCTKLSFEGHQYLFCTADKPWTNAKSDCLANGMDLVTVETDGENTFIAANVAGAAWIGATDAATEGVWKWTASGRQFWQGGKSGAAVGGALARWATGQPDDLLGQDCGRIGSDGRWSDEFCIGPRDYVCEGEGAPKGSPPDTNCQGAVLAGTDYWFCTNDVTWEDARDRCRTQPGVDLASVTSAATNKFVVDRLKKTSWLGGNDRRSEGEWRWAERPSDDGALFWLGDEKGKKAFGAYANFQQTEPDDTVNEDCLEMFPEAGLRVPGLGRLLPGGSREECTRRLWLWRSRHGQRRRRRDGLRGPVPARSPARHARHLRVRGEPLSRSVGHRLQRRAVFEEHCLRRRG
jgi:hypothetical protein